MAAKKTAGKPKDDDVCICGHVRSEHKNPDKLCKFSDVQEDACCCDGFEKEED